MGLTNVPPTRTENQMEETVEHEMGPVIVQWIIGIRDFKN